MAPLGAGARRVTPTELRSRRQALGLSQTALAERLGLHVNTVQRWESDKQPIAHPTVLDLALAHLANQPRPRGRPRKR